MMKIAVFGIGGVGGLIGGALWRGKYDETYFIARGKNSGSDTQRRPPRVESALLGDFTVQSEKRPPIRRAGLRRRWTPS